MRFTNNALGLQDFETLMDENTFYVDKTDFIREWWDNKSQVTLITRPRRFGKTLNMSMLECFFSNRFAGRSDLFEGLSVSEDEELMKLQGTFPVIFLSFASLKSDTYRGFKIQLLGLLEKVFDRYPEIEKDSYFEAARKQINEKTAMGQTIDIDGNVLCSLISSLSHKLCAYYGKKVIILLDEYDTPMQEAYLQGYWDEMVALIRPMFNGTFKSNEFLYRAVMTGITRVSKESIFSDFNNPEIVTTTSKKYATAFGFTEQEVFDALKEQGMSDKKELVKAWYDGFRFGDKKDIYNPWSIINFLSERDIGVYWANTSSNGLVGSLIRKGNPEVKQVMEDLLEGIPLVTEIDEQIVFNQLDEDESAVWSLLLASGYLRVDDHRTDGNGLNEYTLSLTNFEVKLMFEKMISGWFQKGRRKNYNGFVKALLANDLEDMNGYLSDVLYDCISSQDVETERAKRAEPEKFYHALVLGLLVELKGRYVVKSNRESGRGRYDVMLEPEDKTQAAYVIEFKLFDSRKDRDLSEAADRALFQIADRDYDAALLTRGIPKEQIYHYGFAFCGNEVLIKQGERC